MKIYTKVYTKQKNDPMGGHYLLLESARGQFPRAEPSQSMFRAQKQSLSRPKCACSAILALVSSRSKDIGGNGCMKMGFEGREGGKKYLSWGLYFLGYS